MRLYWKGAQLYTHLPRRLGKSCGVERADPGGEGEAEAEAEVEAESDRELQRYVLRARRIRRS